MSASLVGSEMCIRDRRRTQPPTQTDTDTNRRRQTGRHRRKGHTQANPTETRRTACSLGLFVFGLCEPTAPSVALPLGSHKPCEFRKPRMRAANALHVCIRMLAIVGHRTL
eukprot:2770714-Alexandrium_andersonii.AAC.1